MTDKKDPMIPDGAVNPIDTDYQGYRTRKS